jgi:hypothetical protein
MRATTNSTAIFTGDTMTQKTLLADNTPERYKGAPVPQGIQQAQRKECERTMRSAIAAAPVQESLYDDVKPVDANGQISIF